MATVAARQAKSPLSLADIARQITVESDVHRAMDPKMDFA